MQHSKIFLVSLVVSLVLPLTSYAIDTGYVYPVMSPKMSSDYGTRFHPILKASKHHDGIDLAAPKDTPIRAIDSGVVVFADRYHGYGNLIVVLHQNGLTSHYGHCNSFRVKTGEKVKSGQIIGLVGSTGISTGPHLHFEIRNQGQAMDPERFIPGLADSAEG